MDWDEFMKKGPKGANKTLATSKAEYIPRKPVLSGHPESAKTSSFDVIPRKPKQVLSSSQTSSFTSTPSSVFSNILNPKGNDQHKPKFSMFSSPSAPLHKLASSEFKGAKSYADLMKKVEKVALKEEPIEKEQINVKREPTKKRSRPNNEKLKMDVPKIAQKYVDRVLKQHKTSKDIEMVRKLLQEEINRFVKEDKIDLIQWDKRTFNLKNALKKYKVSSTSKPVKSHEPKKEQRTHIIAPPIPSSRKLDERRDRFAVPEPIQPKRILPVTFSAPSEELDYDCLKITGTCTDLEKPYLRLTSVPSPSEIRPVSILMKSVEILERKWEQSKNYAYICEQLKSVRQDLSVGFIPFLSFNRYSM